jgi:hypothetical protein
MSQLFQIGVARRVITSPPHVELAGLGYYLGRKGERVRDALNATAMVIGDGQKTMAIAALDLMYNDAGFTANVRERVAAQTEIPANAVCVNFSHSHNAPTAGLILGAGERNQQYLDFAANAAADAIIEAARRRQPARLLFGTSRLEGMTFNRTRENGPVDTVVSVLRADSLAGRPLAIGVNFHSHCTAHMEVDLNAVGRDWPGDLVDALERELPGCMGMYLQGTCGDVNFRREFNGTEKRFEPARALVKSALDAYQSARQVPNRGIATVTQKVRLPTRRWTQEEVMREREEGLYRLKSGDTTGWLNGVARVCVNLPERLPLRYGGSVEKAVQAVSRFAVEWTDLILPELETGPETLQAEIQAMRIGDTFLAANPSELFTSLGLTVRKQFGKEDLLMLSYSNGSIGYLPDAYDVQRKSYAALQSPKFTGQFPYTEQSGNSMVEGLSTALANLE